MKHTLLHVFLVVFGHTMAGVGQKQEGWVGAGLGGCGLRRVRA